MLNIRCRNVFVSYETNCASDDPSEELTTRVYSALARASAHFDKTLFGSSLPKFMITWQRKRNSRGYFASGRFKAREGETVVDEVALNPTYFAERTTKEILSTLVHEQVHAWQRQHGKPSRTGYHNVEWAKKMEELGLVPSTTGQPGGDKTGQSVSHFIEAGGPFDRACDDLINQGFKIEIEDREKAAAPAKRAANASRNKLTYSCSGCGANTWGKAGLNLICGDCRIALVVV